MTDNNVLEDHALDILLREARTHSVWQDKDVEDSALQALYNLMKWGPTSMNCCPARFVFVRSEEAKQRLKPHLAGGNIDKTMNAPATVIIAYDLEFYEHMGKLAPHNEGARDYFSGNKDLIEDTAVRNGTLQGGYFILAARALGLDCGPMSGFDGTGVKDEFFPEENVEVNFLCNLGYGDPEKVYPRAPRFEFDEVCKIL